MRTTYILLVLLLLSSCKAKETTVERTQTSDTLISKSFEYVSKPIETKYTFSIECDSLGNVKEIKTFESSGLNSASSVFNLYLFDLLCCRFSFLNISSSVIVICLFRIDNHFENPKPKVKDKYYFISIIIPSISLR